MRVTQSHCIPHSARATIFPRGAKRAAESDAASAAKRLRALNAELLERICELPDLVVADLVMSRFAYYSALRFLNSPQNSGPQ